MQGDASLIEVIEGDDRFPAVLALAHRVLAQDRYLLQDHPHADESHILGAFIDGECVGFLRFLVQRVGSDVGRPAIEHRSRPLTEGFVEAFGVAPRARRSGIGTALQERASALCRAAGCYQMRSRSPISSAENYSLKLSAGYSVHPSGENDSYYFTKRL